MVQSHSVATTPGWPWPDLGSMGEWMRGFRGEPVRMEEYQDGGHLVVRVELPGIDPERDVSITVSKGVLRIYGERKESSRSATAQGVRSEFRYGSFERRLVLPPGAGEDEIAATYKDGILEVRVPVKHGEEPRSVPVVSG
jgi:HSP20 family protein